MKPYHFRCANFKGTQIVHSLIIIFAATLQKQYVYIKYHVSMLIKDISIN